ncbi:MAG TPA: hypothetical protein VGS22_28065 [Thermoanaerobaculia bacterium]|nr:hypothetical protein [Thermoanaerobaculia bacterium]
MPTFLAALLIGAWTSSAIGQKPEEETHCLYSGRLLKDCKVRFQNLDLPKGFRLVLNGYDLKVKIEGDLTIGDDATIMSFDPRPSLPPAALRTAAKRGANGRNAGRVSFEVEGAARGTLRIINRGEDGQNGQNGAKGDDGRPGSPGIDSESSVLFCRKGGFPGGRGGDGGNGGAGGSGGNAGLPGMLSVEIEGDRKGFQLLYDLRAGIPGLGGQGGMGGAGGAAGTGGRDSLFCAAAEPGAVGRAGQNGRPGKKGLGFPWLELEPILNPWDIKAVDLEKVNPDDKNGSKK